MIMTKTTISLKLSCLFAVFFICITVFCFPVYAQSGSVHIIDDADVFSSSQEKQIKDKANEAAAKTGFNIVIMSSKDIGTPKTDAHVVEFCDDKYEELCGIETDGILFLINCDTKYDYISTSGACIEYFSDDRIESVLDYIWEDMKAENFGQAAEGFLSRVNYYYDKGRANNDLHTGEYIVSDKSGKSASRPRLIDSLQFIMFVIIFTAMVGSGVYSLNKKPYRIEKPGTRNYILNNSLVFDNKSDVYVGRHVHTTYSPRSSSSGSHRSSGGHHSSVHRSHSGGRHGGGGRHR